MLSFPRPGARPARPTWPRTPFRAPARTPLRAPAAVLLLALAGCTGPGTPPASSPTASRPLTATGVPTATPTPTASAARLPTSCAALLPVTAVTRAVGQPVQGRTTYLSAAPVPQSGRTGRVTCGYGVTTGPDGKDTPPVVEASLIAYVDAGAAQRQLDVTLTAAQGRGNTLAQVTVAGGPAYVLTDPSSATLVLRRDAYTVVVTVLAAAAPADRVQGVLVDLAATLLTTALPAAG